MIVDRRKFVFGSAVLAGTLAGCAAMPGAVGTTARQLGIQLFTVRDIFAADPMGTLESIARIGYREVEYGGGGYDQMDHSALRATMDRLGLTSPSIHVPYEMMVGDFDGAVRMAKTLGADTVVLPWLADPLRTAEGWAGVLANIDPFARRFKDNGLGFAYHNHDFEFTTRHNGRSMFEDIVERTDPELVQMELDLFWTVAAGEDPLATIRRLPGRIYAYHVKDRAADGSMASVGSGTIDFAQIFTLNSLAGVQHLYVENDMAPAPYLPNIEASFAALSRLV